ncbi:MAG: glycosyltransferase, partial [Acidobacteriota bacterium]|nr:glycosyltransferase [Acidobacteriota bacterium]
ENGVEAIYMSSWLRYRATTLNPHVARFCRASLTKFDLVHFYGLYDLLGPVVSYHCRRQRIPYVIEPMGMYRPIDRSIQLKRMWHRTVGAPFWRNASRVIATSELEFQELLAGGVPRGKLLMRYNGVDTDFYGSPSPRGQFRAKWGIPPNEPLILFLSRLIPRKGADILIEAFAHVCSKSGRLLIAGPEGEAGYEHFLKTCAKRAGVSARVLFTGALYDMEKKAALGDADVFVLPSRYENFANVAAEAMARGVPVIISNMCGISSLVEGRAGLVIAPEKDALVNALLRLMEDKALYERLKEGCRQVARELAWDRLTESMEEYYIEILKEKVSV